MKIAQALERRSRDEQEIKCESIAMVREPDHIDLSGLMYR